MNVGGPLAGWRVVVTRAAASSSELARRLEAAGAGVVEVPTIEIADPADGGRALAAWAARTEELDWVVVTSANGAERLVAGWGGPDAVAKARVAAVGPGTAAALRRAGVEPALVPPGPSSGAALGRALPPPPRQGRVLLARAETADPELPRVLAAAGWQVEEVAAYRTVPVAVPAELAAAAGACHAVTFASASAVRSYLASAGRAAVPPVIACIGPTTAAAVAEAGLSVDVVSPVQTLDGLVSALAEEAARRGRPPPSAGHRTRP
ncbi:MAG TPA: uroporphyrinogen-III synthase [Acidimicrobiales bacterium]|nr:uroporphyrinogen-III synthase [Acidimicrobiales bacterium]